MKGTITMNAKETERIAVLDRLMRKELKQHQAGKLLGLSVRQVRRLVGKYQREGIPGIIHKLRGTASNRKITEDKVQKAITIIKEHYSDFGPTLAHEKLTELHGICFSRETLRGQMIKEGLWKPKQRKIITLHQLRERRDCLGELVQGDGSPHDWFEGRRGKCTLLVFIDDATGKLLWLEFAESESTLSYFLAVKHYLLKNGKPLTFYVDRHGVFRINTTKGGTAGVADSNGLTQFGRAMEELSIGVIFANSAQAKGRVEKVNQTLQDRLVKELRLQKISTIEEANRYLPEFIEFYNRKFSVVPKSPANLHRPLLSGENLDEILCFQYQRILSKQLTVSYKAVTYQIKTKRPLYALRYAPVVIREDQKGNCTIWYKKEKLDYTIFNKQPKADIVDSKELNASLDRLRERMGITIKLARTPFVPPQNHPWRRYVGS